jgi:hypothetical protein
VSSNRFSPRIGLAYSPGAKDGILGKLTGGPGKTSVRAGYGIFYSVIEGNTNRPGLQHFRSRESLQLLGDARASSGFPVTLRGDSDSSWMGRKPNGVNNHSLDLPDYNGGPSR